ncbi:MAG: right-handed parallel beta-helix repeat-containing protein [Planctomycetes bacterium]|nr:right-handed parallel beta-helix repeat-containing protein [Planctomycetota bacterium]
MRSVFITPLILSVALVAQNSLPVDVYSDAAATAPGQGTVSSPFPTFVQATDLIRQNFQGMNVTLHLRGTFQGEFLDLRGLGTASLIVQPWGSDTVTIDGGLPVGDSTAWPVLRSQLTSTPRRKAVHIDTDNVTLDGGSIGAFVIRGVAGVGVLIDGADNVTLQHLKMEYLAESAVKARVEVQSWGCYGDSMPWPLPMADGLTIHDCRINQTNLGYYPGQGTTLLYQPECISISSYQNCVVSNNHLSNVLMEGIDFKLDTSGTIRNNIVEFVRSIGIYGNECGPAQIYENIVRYAGYYQVESPSSAPTVATSGAFLEQYWAYPGHPWTNNPGPSAANPAGISVTAGDLCDTQNPGMTFEQGAVQDIAIYRNEIYWTRGVGIQVTSNWWGQCQTGEAKCGCGAYLPVACQNNVFGYVDNVWVFNNTLYRARHVGSGLARSGISVFGLSTSTLVLNNILAGTQTTFGAAIHPAFDIEPDVCHPAFVGAGYQLFYDNQGNDTDTGTCAEGGSGNVFGDPVFVAAPADPMTGAIGGDLSLSVGSPAIDTALPIPGSYVVPDIGAREYGEPAWHAGNL